ncbi:hypothetical protein XELAEV_18015883mg [Xenopus laevis]|uniref:Uncharacterized protein n=1 Tax=Xenopus laevis TaxID=8355 RepID=A0A974DJ89_XENLA|nr:hypothetical protein XELAEV_18015883mg [Xenopus laevis]
MVSVTASSYTCNTKGHCGGQMRSPQGTSISQWRASSPHTVLHKFQRLSTAILHDGGKEEVMEGYSNKGAQDLEKKKNST